MAKQPKKNDAEVDGQDKFVGRHPAARVGAIILGVAGISVILLQKLGVVPGAEWLSYPPLAIVVTAVLTWFLSGMERQHRIEWVKSGLFALSLALVIRWAVAEPYRIPSGSMEPTLLGDPRMFHGDRVFVNKWVYGVRYPFMNKRIWRGSPPERWDIVVFKTVEENALHGTLVKRIVGMPGERVHIRGGVVYINGEALAIPDHMPENNFYTSPSGPRSLPNRGLTYDYYGVSMVDKFAVVPDDHFLMLGDNSNNSRDGRWFGWLPNEHMVGRVASIWWPPSSWRDFTGFSQTLWWRVTVSLLCVWIFARMFVCRSWAVPAGDGRRADHLLINFLSMGLRVPFTPWRLLTWGKPARGDTSLYYPRENKAEQPEFLVGRIAGLPGEQVTLVEGKLHIDGKVIADAPWSDDGGYGTEYPGALYGKPKGKKYTMVPEGHYFILGDGDGEEDGPLDSRVLGWVREDHLAGRATRVWWPLTRARRI